ncbi:MAG: bifunctional demethylmenaquinone methyltransferase/2-methoxy-6-polyprenyl-1,4-benzoquinol methylase UbiE [Deltaproteobacteria bacterium]|nr:bifunctional demethylmenaquinone methyltransferase/2-methoxy-6-polyprenyl-1,4-benzoquinol methylase UbiE [Deltaproteobacteria bacterium]
MDKRPSIIGRMFDRIAPTYDRLNTILSFSIDKAWRRAAIRLLEIRAGDTVLDIATGTGDMAILGIEHGGRVVGIDLSRQMLLHAASKARVHRLGIQYTVVQGDALSMPFRNETFNSAMVAFGIRNIEKLEVFLDEMHRIMNPHGRFSILEFSMPESLPFRLLYKMYLTYVLPVIGGLISGDFKAYRYLRDSVMRFPPPMVLERIMEERNFRIVQSISLFGGISHLYLVEKR